MVSHFLLQMQEAEVQFLRKQNELEINKPKELSNIEVTYNNKIHVLIIITCRYPSLV